MIELLAVCGVIAVPMYVSVILGLIETGFRPWDWPWDLMDALRRMGLLVPQIVLVMWAITRSALPSEEFGVVRPRMRDLALGAGALLGVLVLLAILGRVLPVPAARTESSLKMFLLGATQRGAPWPRGAFEWATYITITIAIALAEELTYRSYLTVGLVAVLGSRVWAAVLSTSAWAATHLHQGLLPVASHFLEGLLFCWIFLRWRRLWPLVLAHAAVNFLLPLIRLVPTR